MVPTNHLTSRKSTPQPCAVGPGWVQGEAAAESLVPGRGQIGPWHDPDLLHSHSPLRGALPVVSGFEGCNVPRVEVLTSVCSVCHCWARGRDKEIPVTGEGRSWPLSGLGTCWPSLELIVMKTIGFPVVARPSVFISSECSTYDTLRSCGLSYQRFETPLTPPLPLSSPLPGPPNTAFSSSAQHPSAECPGLTSLSLGVPQPPPSELHSAILGGDLCGLESAASGGTHTWTMSVNQTPAWGASEAPPCKL